jgi:hypothetical protein
MIVRSTSKKLDHGTLEGVQRQPREQSCVAVTDEVGNASRAASDYRQPGGHCLLDHLTEHPAGRGEHEKVGGRVDVGERLFLKKTLKRRLAGASRHSSSS